MKTSCLIFVFLSILHFMVDMTRIASISILLLLVALGCRGENSVNPGVEAVLINLARLSNTDLHLVSDFSLAAMRDLPRQLADNHIPRGAQIQISLGQFEFFW